MMELVSEAIIFATKAHDSMRRKKSDVPYILHPMEAAVIVASVTDKQEVIAAAMLHDVVEDAGITMCEIEKTFGKRVAELVASETEDKRAELPPNETWKVRKEEAIELLNQTNDLDVKILYLGDKLANIRAVYSEWKNEGHSMWQRFLIKKIRRSRLGITEPLPKIFGSFPTHRHGRNLTNWFR